MDYEELEADRNKILLGLVKFYYESGYKSSAYMDPETGGIYEHKLANTLGYRFIQDDQPPPEFVAATKLLEEQGYVRRMRRNPNVAMMGVWPTSKGLEEIALQRHLEEHTLSNKELWTPITGLSRVGGNCQATILQRQLLATRSSVAVGVYAKWRTKDGEVAT